MSVGHMCHVVNLVVWVGVWFTESAKTGRPVDRPSTVASHAREVVQPKSLKNGSRAVHAMMSEVTVGDV